MSIISAINRKKMKMYKVTALCALGAEKVLSNELKRLGVALKGSAFGRVHFECNLEQIYGALIGLRTADRIMLDVAVFPAANFDELFEGARGAPWEDYIPRGMGLIVDKARVAKNSAMKGVSAIQAQVNKAVAERLMSKFHIRRLPEDDVPQAVVRVHVDGTTVRIYLDITGEPLFKRGYRREGGIAPLRETTAASLLLLAGWKRKFPLYDPFCGSGTIAIEAALFAWDQAPGLGRKFAFGQFLPADSSLEKKVRQEALNKIDYTRRIRIAGSDADAGAVRIAKANLQRAVALARGTVVSTGSTTVVPEEALPVFTQVEMKYATPLGEQIAPPLGFIITNPPYGRRLGDEADAQKNYSEMRHLKKNFPGWKLCCITEDEGFETYFGEKASSCKEITNGPERAYFYQYERVQ
ncbi:MAG: class I SAM-dependent RNA methyltransferase [Spirochaetaceae bacterium]|jgi:putative N6-adenine-specific DNA methylase|nr:class I SAM-dependent RNA methyltransferase [Spirochaetaceae bacterium]